MFASTSRLAKGVAGVLEIESSAPNRFLEAFIFLPRRSVLSALHTAPAEKLFILITEGLPTPDCIQY